MTVYYSGLYYIFPALLDYVVGSTGWSKVEYSATLTIILVSSGLLAPLFGRGVDRGLGPLFLGLTGMLGGLGAIPLLPHLRAIALLRFSPIDRYRFRCRPLPDLLRLPPETLRP
jgi:hypothetical protein